MSSNQDQYLNDLKLKFESYAPISAASWQLIEDITEIQSIKKGEVLLQSGQIAKEIYFVVKGALRAFITDAAGNL